MPEVEPEPPKKLSLKVAEIGRDGKIDIEFNQDIVVPKWFGNQDSTDKKRRLTGVTDVFAIKFGTNSDVSGDSIKYDLVVVAWNPPHLYLAMNFDNPASLSRGKLTDSMTLQVLKPNEFKAVNSDELLDMELSTVITEIPR